MPPALCFSCTCTNYPPPPANLRSAMELYDSVGTEGFHTSYFLNRGFKFEEPLDRFKKIKPSNPKRDQITLTAFEFHSYWRGIAKADLLEREWLDTEAWANSFKDSLAAVPLGLAAIHGELLTQKQLADLLYNKEGPAKKYPTLDVYLAASLKETVFEGTVTFYPPPVETFLPLEQIAQLLIDPDDGQGFRPFSVEKPFMVNYGKTGQKQIRVRMTTPKGTVEVNSYLNVAMLEFEQPTEAFSVTSKNGRANLVGGTAYLYPGCDEVLDRPFVVVEGFDPMNEMGLTDFRNAFQGNPFLEQRLRRNGYDVVYLNFTHGGRDIRQNAEVLRSLLLDLKDRKHGSEPITVLGISMGGLVSRYALRDMELDGITHEVGHFISFDSPHLGANIPVGYQRFVEDINDVDVIDWFNLSPSDLQKAIQSLNSVAAKQMMIRYKGASADPAFTQLQSEFATMGMPQQSRNVAIINGAANGGNQGYQPGDKIFKVQWYSLVVNGEINLYTNATNASNTVSSLQVYTGPVRTTNKVRSFYFNGYNYDLASGGTQTGAGSVAGAINGLPWYASIFNIVSWFGAPADTFGRDVFAFVPTFSAIADQTPLTQQNDLYRSLNNSNSAFDIVYAGNDNTEHTNFFFIRNEWETLIINELGVNIGTGFTCTEPIGTMPAPPLPQIEGSLGHCENTHHFLRVANPGTVNNLYEYTWRITENPLLNQGTNVDRTFYGEEVLLYPFDMPTGTFRLELTVNYVAGINGPSTTLTTGIRRFPYTNTAVCGSCNGVPIGPDDMGEIDPCDNGGRQTEWAESTVEKLQVFPNPAQKVIQLVFPSAAKSGAITIMDAQGKMVMFLEKEAEMNQMPIQLPNLQNGLYFIRFQGSDHVETIRFTIQK